MTPITFEKNERLMFGCISVTDELFFAYLFVGSQDSQRFWIGKKGKVVGSEAKLFSSCDAVPSNKGRRNKSKQIKKKYEDPTIR